MRGRDIKRNSYEFANLYIILAYFGSHKIIPNKYPAIYQHLKQYENKLRNRGQVRYTLNGKPNLSTEYPGQHHWLELDNNPSKKYLDDFNRQKIIYSEIVQSPQFYLDNESEFVAEASSFILTGEHLKYLIHWLNSPTMAYVFRNFYSGGGLGDKGYRYKKTFIENLPIPKPKGDSYYITESEIQLIIGLNRDEISLISSSFNS